MKYRKAIKWLSLLILGAAAVCYDRFKKSEKRMIGADDYENDEPACEFKVRRINNKEYQPEYDWIDNIITLKNSDGSDISFVFLDMIEYKGNNYVVLLPYLGEDIPVVILRERGITHNGYMEEYESVEDEETLNGVYQIFKFKFRNEFLFSDE